MKKRLIPNTARLNRFKQLFVTTLTLILSVGFSRAAEWQWSVPIPPPPGKTNERPRAFLWIPPDCRQVRGVVFGQHNMEEEPVFEHPVFRQALAEIGFAEVWVAPWFDGNFRFDQGAGERLETLLKALAEQSGYAELVSAPLVPVGHSATASVPWYMAAWKPGRVLAACSLSGQWPYVPDEKNAPHVAGLSVDSVPGLVTLGEYEWADERMPKGLAVRAEHPQLPLSGVGCPADGHFDVTDEKVALLALYVKKAAAFRLPKDSLSGEVPRLNAIDPGKTGWLVDCYHAGKDPSAPAAPVGQYRGDPARAFWFFDEELARAAEAFQKLHRGKPALVGIVQDGQILPQTPGAHAQVLIKFHPKDDGVTFKLRGAFLDTVPDGRPARWAGKKVGEAIEKPSGGPPIGIHRITGPIRKLSDDTWELAFTRASFLGDRRGNEAWLAAMWPGDATHKRAIQQAVLQIPGRNSKGTSQTITFTQPSDVKAGTARVKLSAISSSGLPVRYHVLEGPAEVDGDVLNLTRIPPRARFPVRVTVVAWQFGRAVDLKIQSAEPVERTLMVVR